jgi:hypothetical protein
MAILTTASAKAFLGITSTDATRDAQIALFIPAIEEDIASICGRRFRNNDVSFSGDITPTGVGTTYTLTCLDGGMAAATVGWAVGDYIDISGSVRNDGYRTIATISDTAITVTEPIVTEAEASISLYLVQWPAMLPMYAAQMVGYLLDSVANQGITSERIIDYSYTREANSISAGYPLSIVNSLRYRFGYMSMGTGVKREQYNDKRGTFLGATID